MEQSSVNQKSNPRRLYLIVGISLAIISVVVLLIVEAHYRQQSPNGYLQSWTSESLWQTVSIEDLRDQPFQSIWNLHIQPPMLDAIRTVFAQVWKSDDSKAMLTKVDHSIYILWAFVYGMIIFVTYWWLVKSTNILFAVFSALLLSIHPALIAYSVILDSTLLSSFFILLFYFLLWRVKSGYSVSAVSLAISFLLLFLTRSIFQWQWLILLTFALILMKFPWRKLLIFISITGIVVGLYTVKQIVKFDLSSTSSFSGFNLCQSINCIGATNQYSRVFDGQNPPPVEGIPYVLTRVTKIEGNTNFNNADYLEANRILHHQFNSQFYALLHTPLKLLELYNINLKIYLTPSSKYEPIVMVDQFPLRKLYDSVFSYPILIVLLALALLSWIFHTKKHGILQTLGFCLPLFFIIFICIVGDRGENMRFKFFVEPVIFVFLATQVFATGKTIIDFIKRKLDKTKGSPGLVG